MKNMRGHACPVKKTVEEFLLNSNTPRSSLESVWEAMRCVTYFYKKYFLDKNEK